MQNNVLLAGNKTLFHFFVQFLSLSGSQKIKKKLSLAQIQHSVTLNIPKMEIKRTFDIAEHAFAKYPQEDALAVKRNGKWEKVSSENYQANSNYISSALIELGIKKGDKIATVSNNRPEWNYADIGMSKIGAVHVPIYPTISHDEYTHIFNHSDAKILIVSSQERYDYLKETAATVSSISKVYSFDKLDGVAHFDELLELGKKNYEKNKNEIEARSKEVDENDLCSIIYTSGTTGLSKGVMMTHKNFVSNVRNSEVAVPQNVNRALSFLPLCHVFERMLNYLYQSIGISIYYAESIETVADNLKEVKPEVLAAVPRVIEKVYDKIYAKGKELTGVKKGLFFWALRLAEKYDPNKDMGFAYNKKLAVARKLIFVKWQEVFGSNVKAIVSGGAALQPRLSRIFCAAGIPVLEGYGLSETAPVIAVNRLDNINVGTVGVIIEEAEVTIGQRDEILFKGPNLMAGYYKDPEKTAQVIDKDGWFHTGDTGKLLPGNILKITGRIKELFKLSTGKYVAPALIENKFKESPFIEQLMVIGEGEKFCGALISPNFEFLHNWASVHNIKYGTNIELISNPITVARFQEEVDKFNTSLDKTMKIKQFALVARSWTTDTGELSATLKLKRRVINEIYKTRIQHVFGHSTRKGYVE